MFAGRAAQRWTVGLGGVRLVLASGVGTDGRCRHGLLDCLARALRRRGLFFRCWHGSFFFFLQGDAIGRDLDKDTTEALSEEQAAKLDELAVAARTVARGGEDETGAPHDGK